MSNYDNDHRMQFLSCEARLQGRAHPACEIRFYGHGMRTLNKSALLMQATACGWKVQILKDVRIKVATCPVCQKGEN